MGLYFSPNIIDIGSRRPFADMGIETALFVCSFWVLCNDNLSHILTTQTHLEIPKLEASKRTQVTSSSWRWYQGAGREYFNPPLKRSKMDTTPEYIERKSCNHHWVVLTQEPVHPYSSDGTIFATINAWQTTEVVCPYCLTIKQVSVSPKVKYQEVVRAYLEEKLKGGERPK